MRGDFERRILSQPVELHWNGWRSTTHELQSAGWSISAEQNIERMTMQMAFRSPMGDAYGVSSQVPWEYMQDRQFGFGTIPLHADMRFGREVTFHTVGGFPAFDAIDAQPRMTSERRARLEDFAHFAAPLVRTRQLVVPEESVSDLMERILKLQQPDRTERLRESVREGSRIEMPKHKFHAQIMSFAA